MRIDKLLTNLKYGSRKDIQNFIKDKQVTVNGTIIKKKDFNVNPKQDVITLFGETVYYKETVILMLHKPAGYVCANHDNLHKTVFELIGEPYNRFDLNIAGRLDIDTEGLVLLTNNGTVLHNIISPKKDVYKKYYVEVEKEFKNPTVLDGNYHVKDAKDNLYQPLKPFVEKIDDKSFYLSIKEGKFHQVKRMVAHFNNKVTYLKRVAIGNIELGNDVQLGEYKEIKNQLDF